MMFGHGLFQTRASMAAQIKTQATTIGELSALVAKQDGELRSIRANRQISEGIFNARIRELTDDRNLALSARDEAARQRDEFEARLAKRMPARDPVTQRFVGKTAQAAVQSAPAGTLVASTTEGEAAHV